MRQALGLQSCGPLFGPHLDAVKSSSAHPSGRNAEEAITLESPLDPDVTQSSLRSAGTADTLLVMFHVVLLSAIVLLGALTLGCRRVYGSKPINGVTEKSLVQRNQRRSAAL